MQQGAQKPRQKFCARKTAKMEKTPPKSSEKGETGCVLGAGEDGSIKSLTPRQVADLLGHSTSQITELYYVKKDTSRLHGITDGFNL